MRRHWITAAVACLAIGIMAWTPLASAADPAAVQAPIKGSDVMGDKGRTGPDGWSWAPQTRDQAPADKSADKSSDPNSRPGPDTGKKLAPGDDPGTPVASGSHGPGPGAISSPSVNKP